MVRPRSPYARQTEAGKLSGLGGSSDFQITLDHLAGNILHVTCMTAGRRPVLEALLEVEAGRPLDEVLAAYGRLPPELYRLMGADVLPIDEITIIDGGRA